MLFRKNLVLYIVSHCPHIELAILQIILYMHHLINSTVSRIHHQITPFTIIDITSKEIIAIEKKYLWLLDAMRRDNSEMEAP